MEYVDYLLFCEGTHWNQRFLKEGFGHCYVLRCIEKTTWVLFDPRQKFVDSRAYATRRFLPALMNQVNGHRWLRVPKCEPSNRQYFCAFNCVSTCKFFVGIEAPLVQTPYQLYKWIRDQVIMSMNDDTVGNFLDDKMADNDSLLDMQKAMRANSLKLLNDEMVRSSAFFGFGGRPEPGTTPPNNNPGLTPVVPSTSVPQPPKGINSNG